MTCLKSGFPLSTAKMTQVWSTQPFDRPLVDYKTRIQHLEDVVQLLLAKQEPALFLSTSVAPLAGLFWYLIDRGLVPVLSKKTTLITTDWHLRQQATNNHAITLAQRRALFNPPISQAPPITPSVLPSVHPPTSVHLVSSTLHSAPVLPPASEPNSSSSLSCPPARPIAPSLAPALPPSEAPNCVASSPAMQPPLASILNGMASLPPPLPLATLVPSTSSLLLAPSPLSSPSASVSSLANLTVIWDLPIANSSSPVQSHSSEPISASPTSSNLSFRSIRPRRPAALSSSLDCSFSLDRPTFLDLRLNTIHTVASHQSNPSEPNTSVPKCPKLSLISSQASPTTSTTPSSTENNEFTVPCSTSTFPEQPIEPTSIPNCPSGFDIAAIGSITIVDDTIESPELQLAPEDSDEALQWDKECQEYYNDIEEALQQANADENEIKKKKKKKASNPTATPNNPVLFYA
ncbi:hypothetical protein PCASD_12354 [Puccinia coronata f. sp. avenae]|uniref:Uncharacterized protein n=1 Tax=Puccinia coronata f. sp. avenae TaxID=200324 RepID=A0A2N5U898_9BASI|nr:hypothetical protein PCASD_12354 [Puccinia coronata f. sp. avenae]